jgi:hypothetical protein
MVDMFVQHFGMEYVHIDTKEEKHLQVSTN